MKVFKYFSLWDAVQLCGFIMFIMLVTCSIGLPGDLTSRDAIFSVFAGLSIGIFTMWKGSKIKQRLDKECSEMKQ